MNLSYETVLLTELENEFRGIQRELQAFGDGNPYFIAATTAGSGALVAGLAIASLPAVGAIGAIAATMAIGAGVAGVGIGLAGVLSGTLGRGEDYVAAQKSIDLALDITGSPIVLATAAMAALGGEREDFEKWVEVGKLVDAVSALKSGFSGLRDPSSTPAVDFLQSALGFKETDFELIDALVRERAAADREQQVRSSQRKREETSENKESKAREKAADEARLRDQQRRNQEKYLAWTLQNAETQKKAIEEQEQQRIRERQQRAAREKEVNDAIERAFKAIEEQRKEEAERKKKEAEEAAKRAEEKEKADKAARDAASANATYEASQKNTGNATSRKRDQRRGVFNGAGGSGAGSSEEMADAGTSSTSLP